MRSDDLWAAIVRAATATEVDHVVRKVYGSDDILTLLRERLGVRCSVPTSTSEPAAPGDGTGEGQSRGSSTEDVQP